MPACQPTLANANLLLEMSPGDRLMTMELDLGEQKLKRTCTMLKLITLAACVIGFVFIGPKALAEFRQVWPGTRTVPSPDGTGDKPQSGIAA